MQSSWTKGGKGAPEPWRGRPDQRGLDKWRLTLDGEEPERVAQGREMLRRLAEEREERERKRQEEQDRAALLERARKAVVRRGGKKASTS